jgi:mono/diheme cytochrome c family protein
MYEATCAACHGMSGRPNPDDPVAKALDPPPAVWDFADGGFLKGWGR